MLGGGGCFNYHCDQLYSKSLKSLKSHDRCL
nr:MAG TPA: hypothetical protein [Caudoviricetes sp.]